MTATGRNKDEVDISGSTICLEVHMIERAGKAGQVCRASMYEKIEKQNRTAGIIMMQGRNPPAPDSPKQGRIVANHGAHNPESPGSIPAPATFLDHVKKALEIPYIVTMFMIGVLTLLLCDFALYIPRRLNPTTTTNIRSSVCVVRLLAIIIIIIITYWLVIWR